MITCFGEKKIPKLFSIAVNGYQIEFSFIKKYSLGHISFELFIRYMWTT